MRGDIAVEQLPSLQAQDYEHEQQPEGHRRHPGEVDGNRLPEMIPNKGPPTSRGRFSMSWQVLRDRRLGDRDSEVQELAVNPWSAPGGVRLVHLHDQLSDLGGDRRPARPALPAPVEAQALSVPAEDRLGLDQDESLAPSGPELREPDPHQSIGGPKLGSPPRALALEDEELMAQGEYLGLECGPAAEQRSERRKSGQKGRSHAGVRLTQTPGFLNDHGPDQILGRESGADARNPTSDKKV